MELMSKKKWIIILAVVIVAAGAYGMSKVKANEASNEEETMETMTLESKTVEERLLMTGVVTAETEVMKADLVGEITEILVNNGDSVQEGDLLFVIEPEDLSVSIAEAKSNVDSAKRKLDQAEVDGGQSVRNQFLRTESSYLQAKLDYEMQEQLFDLGTASETAVTSARQAVLNAQSSYISAKADWETYSLEEEIASLDAKVLRAEETLETLLEQEDGAQVTATINGVVSGLDLSIGDEVQTGLALVEITDTENLTVEASVSEYEIGKLTIGQKLEVAPIADDDDISIATITYIAPKGSISNSDTTFEIEAVVEKKSTGLLANATVNLDILVAQAKDTLAVPYEAMITNGARSMVMMQQGDEFMPIPVEQGVKGDLYVEISSPELSVGSVIQIPSTSVVNFQRMPGMMPGAGGGAGAGRNIN
jgi:HlyD family secretion protein